MSPLSTRKLSLSVALVTIISSLLIHVYLSSLHYKLKLGIDDGAASACQMSDRVSCEVTVASSYSELFGVPMAVWAAFTHLAGLLILILFITGWSPERGRENWRLSLRFYGAFVFAMSIIMAAISSFVIKVYCPFCIVTYVLSLFILISIFRLTDEKEGRLDLSLASIMPLIWFPLSVLALGFLINSSQQKSMFGTSLSDFVDTQVAEWNALAPQNFETIEPTVMGAEPQDAVITIVEFADFRCGHCKTASPKLKAFVQSHPDTRLEFQAFPLDGECNPEIPQANGASCKLAYAAYCATVQDQGWPAQAWIFERQEKFFDLTAVNPLLTEMAKELKLDTAKFDACVADSTTQEVIRKQSLLGKQVGVKGTPTILVNKKRAAFGQLTPVLEGLYQAAKKSK